MSARMINPDRESFSQTEDRVKREGNVWRSRFRPYVAACQDTLLRLQRVPVQPFGNLVWIKAREGDSSSPVYVAIPVEQWDALVQAMQDRP